MVLKREDGWHWKLFDSSQKHVLGYGGPFKTRDEARKAQRAWLTGYEREVNAAATD